MAALDEGETYDIGASPPIRKDEKKITPYSLSVDDLDALLDSEPVEADPNVEPAAAARAPTKVMTDYTRWNKVAKAIDREDEEDEEET